MQKENIELVDFLKEDVNIDDLQPQQRANIRKMIEYMRHGIFSPTELGEKLGVHRSTVWRYQKLLGKEARKRMYNLDQLVGEIEVNYYMRKKRLEDQVKMLTKIAEKEPKRYKLWQAIVKLEYCISRLDSERLINLRTLRVIPMKGETKFVKVSGGYVRSNVGIYEKNEDETKEEEVEEEVENEPERVVKKTAT